MPPRRSPGRWWSRPRRGLEISGTGAGTIYLDQVVATFDGTVDSAAPVITAELDPENRIITGSITDGVDGILPAERISISSGGEYEPATGRFTVTVLRRVGETALSAGGRKVYGGPADVAGVVLGPDGDAADPLIRPGGGEFTSAPWFPRGFSAAMTTAPSAPRPTSPGDRWRRSCIPCCENRRREAAAIAAGPCWLVFHKRNRHRSGWRFLLFTMIVTASPERRRALRAGRCTWRWPPPRCRGWWP